MNAPENETTQAATDAPQPPRYRPGERLRQAEFARREGVSRQTVTRWIQEGRISPPGADGRLDAQQAHAERHATESPLPHHQGAKAAKARERAQNLGQNLAQNRPTAPVTEQGATVTPGPGADAPQGQPARPGSSSPTAASQAAALLERTADVSAALKLETWRLQKAKAEAANIAIDRDAGLLVERTVVEYLLRDLGETIRAELSAFPDLYAPELAAERGDPAALHKRLADATHAALERIADAIGRGADERLPAVLVGADHPSARAEQPA